MSENVENNVEKIEKSKRERPDRKGVNAVGRNGEVSLVNKEIIKVVYNKDNVKFYVSDNSFIFAPCDFDPNECKYTLTRIYLKEQEEYYYNNMRLVIGNCLERFLLDQEEIKWFDKQLRNIKDAEQVIGYKHIHSMSQYLCEQNGLNQNFDDIDFDEGAFRNADVRQKWLSIATDFVSKVQFQAMTKIIEYEY